MEKIITEKLCRKCNTIKPLSDFRPDNRKRRTKYGVHYDCKVCETKRRKAYAENNREKINQYQQAYKKTHKYRRNKEHHRNLDLIRKYGITKEDYDKLLDSQNGKCKTCQKTSRLVVDHDHKTGKVRGLLCRNCNVAIGLIHDDKMFY